MHDDPRSAGPIPTRPDPAPRHRADRLDAPEPSMRRRLPTPATPVEPPAAGSRPPEPADAAGRRRARPSSPTATRRPPEPRPEWSRIRNEARRHAGALVRTRATRRGHDLRPAPDASAAGVAVGRSSARPSCPPSWPRGGTVLALNATGALDRPRRRRRRSHRARPSARPARRDRRVRPATIAVAAEVSPAVVRIT